MAEAATHGEDVAKHAFLQIVEHPQMSALLPGPSGSLLGQLIESRVKAEAMLASDRLTRVEARLDRMAEAIRSLLAERENAPDDGE